MKIEIKDGKALVYAPYNQDFVKAIKNIGGAVWNGEAWKVPEAAVSAVREIMQEIYGETDISTPEKVDVRLTFVKDVEEYLGAVTIFGKTIARANRRYSTATVYSDVSFVKGAPKCTGSMRNWYTTIPEGSVCVVSNVPKNMLENEIPEGVEFEVLESTPNKQDLEAEKKRLLERIKEIDRILETC